MTRPSLFECPSIRRFINQKQLALWSDFYIRHKDVFLPVDQKMAILKKPSPVSAMSTIYNHAIDAGLHRLFSLVSLSKDGLTTAPEVVSYQYATFDTEQILPLVPGMAPLFSSIPDLNNKMILNITQNYRPTTGTIANVPKLQELFVRDILSRSYYKNTRSSWLTSNLTQFLCKVYSMSIGDTVAYWANLDLKTRGLVVTIFAYFYLSLMVGSDNAKAMMLSDYRAMDLPEPVETTQNLALIEGILSKPTIDTFDEAIQAVNGIGVGHLQISRPLLVQRLKSYGPDYFSVGIAFDYPPYFAYLILCAAAGSKNGLSKKLKDGKGLWNGAKVFADDLARSSLFIPALS